MLNKNITPSSGTWKSSFFSDVTYYADSPLTVTFCKAPCWSGKLFPYSVCLKGHFPSVFLSHVLYKASTFRFCHLRTEDGDSTFSETFAFSYETTPSVTFGFRPKNQIIYYFVP
jgi:hypothetical protein